ncbi:TraR/DksA family transcriptional regulator [Dehalogenimonas alkenigignens]|uniref:Transcriptional regulator, TraR/DksA family n=1 Tax=Dehalogenimonas alkenigignens TaxID=1217799 RepID=A0A0W0GG81_9CHLR|nr:TraR/DksA C4-type zinc finger protein [Dehalogenimonas alkenigignens]KTB47533.1 transcriptional regulator, TraR/DksA family [Dehalogenimonas alkenigignens]PVV83414.1 molecular chaperone DnaK [Dehalogenimonas alkenigignens]
MATENKEYNFDNLRTRLKGEYQRLSDQLEALRATRPQEDRREGSPFGKREEEATETADLENRLALEKRVLDQMAEVDYALGKLEKGVFGRCENCGQVIDPARMEILPYAKYCVVCKGKLNRSA